MLQKIAQKSLFPLFLISLCLLPLSLETNLGFLPANIIFIIEPLAVVFCILISFLSIIHFRKFQFSILDKLVSLYVLFTFLSALLSNNQITSFKYSITILWYVCIGYVLPQWISQKQKLLKQGFKSYLIGIGLLVLFVIFHLYKYGIFFESSYIISYPFIPEGHTNLSIILEPALIATLFLWLHTQKKIFAGGFITSLGLIMYSCSRASYISLIVLFIVSCILLRKEHRLQVLKISILGFVLSLGLWYLSDYAHYLKYKDASGSFFKDKSLYYNSKDPSTYKHTSMFNELGEMDEYKKNKSNNERVERWKAGLTFFTNNVFTGIGVGTYPDKYLEYIKNNQKENELNELQLRRMNIHNLYLSWLVEGGILLFLVGLSIISYVIWKNIEYIRSKKYSIFKVALLLFFLSFLFHGLGQDFSQNPRVIIPFWIIISLYYSRNRNENKVKSSK